jgi:hypothetical protein
MIYIYEHPSLVIPAVEGRPGTVLVRLPRAGQVSAVGRRLRRGRARGVGARSFCAEYCWGELAAERIVEGALLKGRV